MIEEPWPPELRLLHRAFEEGRLDAAWVRTALGEDPGDDALAGSTESLTGESQEPLHHRLADPTQRRERFHRLSLWQRVGEAAVYALVRTDLDLAGLPSLLADGIEAGRLSVTGVLGLLGQCSGGDETQGARLMEALFRELSERAVDVWGLGDETDTD